MKKELFDPDTETVCLRICLCEKTCINAETLNSIINKNVIIYFTNSDGIVEEWKPQLDEYGRLKLSNK